MRKELFIVASLAGCATTAPAPDSRSAPAPRSISFELSSWGRPISVWTVESSGTGRYTISRAAPSRDFHEYDLVTRSIVVSQANFQRIEDLLRPARAYAGRELPCRPTLTDGAYGKVQWEDDAGTHQVQFDTGCLSKKVGPIYERFWQAEELVQKLGEGGTIVETREIRQPRS